MPAGFHAMEESLKDFLNEANTDHYNKNGSNFYKYNNLRIYMDPKKSKRPHFIVRIGMSEGIYDILTYDKISGGLGAEGRYIKRWAERCLSKVDLNEEWNVSNKLEAIDMTEALKFIS